MNSSLPGHGNPNSSSRATSTNWWMLRFREWLPNEMSPTRIC